MDALFSFDLSLFHVINSGLGNPLFDALLPWCREKLFWAPFYLFILAFLSLNFGKKGIWVALGMVCCVGLSDFSSNHLFKKRVQRLRPCNDPAVAATVQLRLPACGSGYSFTSAHAANHFAAAVFLIGFLGPLARWVRPALLTWAGTIALAQVYVGVHYPSDVLAGGLWGAAMGWWALRTARWMGIRSL